MNYYGEIDLSAFFGAEVRVLDGEEHICIPKRFNPAIRFFGSRPLVLMSVKESRRPDQDGFTHAIYPYLPRRLAECIPEADYIKMTAQIGRLRPVGQRPAPEPVQPEQPKAIGAEVLASRPVTDSDIPL